MKVFISWSKSASRELALLLHDWLPEVIQTIDPWMSTENIDKGRRWAAELGAQLGELGQGVLCVTPENITEPWLNFEAGALAKSLDDARVRPVLLDLQPVELTGPLAQFQATMARDRGDMLKLAQSLNEGCEKPLDAMRLERAFERTWPELAKRLDKVQAKPVIDRDKSSRSQEDMISEVLERVRELQRVVDKPNRVAMTDAVLGDGSPVRRGMRVIHDKAGPGRVDGLVRPATLGDPLGALLHVVRDSGGGRIVLPANELRRQPLSDRDTFPLGE